MEQRTQEALERKLTTGMMAMRTELKTIDKEAGIFYPAFGVGYGFIAIFRMPVPDNPDDILTGVPIPLTGRFVTIAIQDDGTSEGFEMKMAFSFREIDVENIKPLAEASYMQDTVVQAAHAIYNYLTKGIKPNVI